MAHAVVNPGTAKTASFSDETTPKKVLSAHGSRDADKSWCEVKPPNTPSVGTGSTGFPGGIAPAGLHCSLFDTSPQLQEGATMAGC